MVTAIIGYFRSQRASESRCARNLKQTPTRGPRPNRGVAGRFAMSVFQQRLDQASPDLQGRRWIYIPYDQLSDGIGPLANEPAAELGIVMVESRRKARRRPYHKQKLAMVLANQRHFALEQAARGVAVRYEFTEGGYAEALEGLTPELGRLRAMRPAERELRRELQPLVDTGKVEFLEHEGWLTTRDQFLASRRGGGPPWRMDAFYRHMRRSTGILMDGKKPSGGKYSFDSENRRAWRGEPPPPDPPAFRIDEIKSEVGELIRTQFARHPGQLDLAALPATQSEAQRSWDWAKESCLPHFGPFQDAMARSSASLFHTRISPLLNLHRLLPARVLADALELDLPLASREGFVRQVLGWREFVRHVHEETDGFRNLPESDPRIEAEPGDGGYARWSGTAWPRDRESIPLGGVAPSALDSRQPLPKVFWDSSSGLACLDHVVSEVWRTAYGHHITRLMVLANLATLLDVSPRELTDWFWVAYADAYDWVVEPNVLGMGSYAVGDFMTTKPYVSGAAYIDRMSDYCEECRFDPKGNCPITHLYWAFLRRHESQLSGNPRLRLPMASSRKRSEDQHRQDEEVFRWVAETLANGETLSPEDQPD